jgi:hypothetical protein
MGTLCTHTTISQVPSFLDLDLDLVPSFLDPYLVQSPSSFLNPSYPVSSSHASSYVLLLKPAHLTILLHFLGLLLLCSLKLKEERLELPLLAFAIRIKKIMEENGINEDQIDRKTHLREQRPEDRDFQFKDCR